MMILANWIPRVQLWSARAPIFLCWSSTFFSSEPWRPKPLWDPDWRFTNRSLCRGERLECPNRVGKHVNIPRLSDEVVNYNLLVQLPAGVLLRAQKPVYVRLVFASENTNQISNNFSVLGSFMEIQAPAPNINFLVLKTVTQTSRQYDVQSLMACRWSYQQVSLVASGSAK